MKVFKKSIVITVLSLLLLSQVIYAEEITTQATSSPSDWAIWDVQMSYTYGLGEPDTYQNYTDEIKGSQFLLIESKFENKFDVTDDTKINEEAAITRGDVINELYDVIQLTLEVDKQSDALKYFINNGLIRGRSCDGNYALDKTCTNEEMLVFSKRVYDHLIYSLNLESKGAFWEARDDDNTVYLLGSVHATDGSVYPMSKDILNAFVESDALVVEANVLSPNQEDAEYVQQLMMIEGDGTIDQFISEDTYNKYVETVESIGLAPETYNKLKPWYAAMLIQNVQMANSSYSGSMGIDLYFLSMATNWKPILELESIKFQIDMFDSFSPRLQEEYLLGALEDEAESINMIEEIISYWKSGDIAKLENLIFSDIGETETEKEFNEKIWDTRNENMVTKVKAMLVEDDTNDYFVVVGAGHMLNDNGIVQSLKDLGYTVEQVK